MYVSLFYMGLFDNEEEQSQPSSGNLVENELESFLRQHAENVIDNKKNSSKNASNKQNSSSNNNMQQKNGNLSSTPDSSGTISPCAETASKDAAMTGSTSANGTAASSAASGGSTATGTTAASSTAASSTAAGSSAAGSAAAGSAAAAGSSAAAPVIVVVICIAVVILLFIIILSYLEPQNVTKTATAYSEQKETSADYNIIDKLRNFFSSIFASSEDIERIEVNELDYDNDNEFDVGYIGSYNAINTAINYHYKENVIGENGWISTYCNENNLDYSKTLDAINEKYPNGWRDIYANVNYGELIDILSLGYNTNAYGENIEKGDTQALQDFLLNDNMNEVFFKFEVVEIISESHRDTNQITSTESSESSTEESKTISTTSTITYASINIHPYCVSDIFNILNIEKDAEYDVDITYYDMLSLMQLQDLATCEDKDGTYRTIYYTLGLDKPLATWDYTFSSATVDDLFQNTSTIVTQGSNPETVYVALKQAGFTDAGAAAVCGNLDAENGFRTSMSGDAGSVGIAQWRGPRKDALINHAQSLGMDVTDIRAQTSYLICELNNSKYNCIRNATDVIVAADQVAYLFERPSSYPSKEAHDAANSKWAWSRYLYSETFNTYIIDLKKRRDKSVEYYRLYAGKDFSIN